MQRTIQILLLTNDSGLETEVAGFAAEVADDVRAVVHVENDERRALARAMERRVDLLLVELDQDSSSVARLAAELQGADHPPVLVATYRPQEFEGDDPLSARFVELLRAGVRDFLSRPLSTSELRSLLDRELSERAVAPRSVGRVLSFVGSKGGVGKSTLAANTAAGLARYGTVLLLDASLQHGVAADLFGLDPEASFADAAREVERLDARLLGSLAAHHPCGVHVLAAPANAIEAAAVDEGIVSRLVAVARRAYDFVVIDTFPLLDSVTLAILDLSDLAYVVLNDSAPTVKGTAGLLEVLDRVGLDRDRVKVALNRTHPGRGLGVDPADVATRLDRVIDYVVPFSKSVLAAANSGKPPAASRIRLGRWGRALAAIARDAASGSLVERAARSAPEETPGVLERVETVEGEAQS